MVDYDAMFKISCGLFVVATTADGKSNGCIVNTALQVTYKPLRFIVVVDKNTLTHEMLLKSGSFAVSALAEGADREISIFGYSSGRESDKFSQVAYKLDENGNPLLLENTVAHLSGKVISTVDVGTHTIFVASVDLAEITDNQRAPLTYGCYRSNRAKPEAAVRKPSHGSTAIYMCSVCKYEYRDEEHEIPFEQLPEDFVCPVCKKGKSAFKRVQ